MSKIAFTADWHLRGKDLEACRAQLNGFVEACRTRNVGTVVVAGDIFDNPQIGDQYASTGAIASLALDTFRDLFGIVIYVIQGQHDQTGPSVSPATEVLRGCSNVKVVSKPDMVRLADGLWLVVLPWQWAGSAEKALADLYGTVRGSAQRCVLAAHCHVAGARLNGMAFKPHFHVPRDGAWDWALSRSVLKEFGFRHIALGDFHARQTIVPGVGGYVGALRQCNFGEEGNPAGFEVWDSESGEVEWVELDRAPAHKTFVVREGEDVPTPVDLDGWIARVRFVREPQSAETKVLTDAGATIEQIVDRPERVRRAEIAAGVLDDPHALMAMWAGTREPALPEAAVARMLRVYDGIFGDVGGQPCDSSQ